MQREFYLGARTGRTVLRLLREHEITFGADDYKKYIRPIGVYELYQSGNHVVVYRNDIPIVEYKAH